ncbi:MAG: aldo/keto reductase [Clostridiales bacterium]|nr:aldo/keto reductase [Clostridiales bacterium]
MGEKFQSISVANVNKPLSKLVFGTALKLMTEGGDANQLLDQVMAMGVNVFDTAADYGDSEASLGNWVTARENRNKIVVITKGANTSRWRRRLTVHDIVSDFMTSLAKLQTDYVDIYFLHRDDPTVSVGPIVEQLNDLYLQGKVRAYGGSNWTVDRIEQANEYAYKHDLQPFTVSSPSYSLAEMIADPCGDSVTLSGDKNSTARDWYQKNQMPVFAYSCLGRGFFSGKLKSDFTGKAEELIGLGGLEYGFPVNFERLRRVEILAEKYGKSVSQIALAWLVAQPLNLLPITSTGTISHLKDSIEAMKLQLSEQECLWLNLQTESLDV